MKRKSNFSIKIMTILIAGAIGISCFTTACQVVKLTAETDTGAGQTGEAEGTDAGSAYYEITELTDYDLDREKNQDILGSVLFDDEIVLVTRESTPMSTEAAMALTDRRADEYADEIIPARYSFMFLDFEGVWKKTIDITNIFESDIGVNSDLQVGKIGGDTIYLIADRYDEENFGKKNIYYVDLSGVCNEKKTLPMQLADEYVRMPFYHSVALDEAGNIYTTESYDEYNRKVSLRVTPFDSTSESFIIEVGDEKSTNNTFDGAMKRIGSGIYVNVDICAANGDFEEAKLCKVDIENKKLGEFLEIDVGQIFNYSPFQNTDNSMIYTDFTGVYQIDEKTMTIQMLLSWSKQDFLVRDNDTSDIVAYLLPNEQILLNRGIFDSTTDPESTMTSFRLYMMKKAQDPNQNKTKLTISGIDILGDTLLEKEIYKYNQTTEDFRIEIKNYDVNLAYAENWRTEIKLCKEEMYADILSGNGPDIILGDAETTSFFMNRELLTDLNGFIEKDTEFQMEEFNPKVMEFGKKDGKQYVLYSSFTIGALVGAKSVIEDRQTWTFEEFDEVTKDFQDSKKVFWNATQASILGNVLASEGGNYYKEGAKIADFTSRRFKDILVFAKKYGMTEDEFSKAVRYVDNYETLFSGGEIALESFAPIYSPLDYLILEDRFAAPITMIGYPSNEGSKVSFSMNKSFAIIENSGHKEEAWEFVKKFFSQENQTQTYTFPTHIETAEALIDEYKNYQAEENILPLLGASHPLSDEGAIVLKELLKSEGQISMLNYDVLLIVTEEAQPYFLDQKSIDQTVEIIQNRVQTYLNEKE